MFIPDTNECATGVDVCSCDVTLTGCSVSCHNTNGGYDCACAKGYTLDTDGTTCIGMTSCNGNRFKFRLNVIKSAFHVH